MHESMQELLFTTAARASAYLDHLQQRSVQPYSSALDDLSYFDESLPNEPSDPLAVLATLDEYGSPASMASAGGRYFGFVTGGTLPAALAASWMASAWDQNASLRVMSPISAHLEDVTLGWLSDLLGLPSGCGGAYVSGATLANLAGLAAARHALLQRQGWDVEAQGLFGAPELRVVVGDEVHVSVIKALGLLGLGHERLIRVPTDEQGRMRAELLSGLDERTIVCTQAGNVNTGAIDPLRAICDAASPAGAWVHVDGAFGMWAAAAPEYAALVDGVELADSWATDGHKWLNVPYDSGMVFCRRPDDLRGAMTVVAPYLVPSNQREPQHYGPEFSRRARGVEIWAALKSLGRSGVAELIAGCCRHAKRFAEGLDAAGYEVRNEVTLNQVLVSFGDDARTQAVIKAIQDDGTCWCGGTVWHGRASMRISISSWATTSDDVERSLEAMIRVAGRVRE